MQLAVLVGLGVGAALLIFAIKTMQQILRHARLAKQLNCMPATRAFPSEPSGIMTAIRFAKASAEKRFPDYFQEQLSKIQQERGKPVGTVTIVEPIFKDTIFTTDPQNIQTMLAVKFNDFGLGVSRTDNFKPLLGSGIFAANGKQWEHSRALLRPQFVRSQVSNLNPLEGHVQALMAVIERHLDRDMWTSVIDLQVLFFRLTLDSATEFLFGESVHNQLDFQDQISANNKDDNSFAFAFDSSQYTLSIAAGLNIYYWVMHTPNFRRMVKRVHDFIDCFVQKALQKGQQEKPAAEKERYIFLRALAEQTQDPSELRSQLLNILFAGRDSTASLLGWFFYTMSETRYQPIFKRLRTIIVRDFGTYSSPTSVTFERMKSCQYLQWCINEVLRLYPIVPMNVRTAFVDTTLPTGGGPDGCSPIFVPKGTDVGYSVHIMHRRKDLWGTDADIFRPERWEDKKPGWDYLPFNGGPRICIGQQFALTEVAYVVIRLMQRLDVIDGSTVGPVKHGLTLTNCPADGVKVRLHFTE